jgi:hypothetical protein
MQTALPGKPWILEVCPASILKRMNLYLPCKGKGVRETENRQWILNSVIQTGLLHVEDEEIKTRLTVLKQPEYVLEGVVYF